ncbi:hypothetical protein BC829DRAFT_493270 [Chytridium lagenaria]|nr:hypothetical protein BC829DRAFT_493270 [Chytridium lagenaria]
MEEEEICRVCRSNGTPDHPLFHPCKCSGSMKFVHQDCLEEWLAHSRKKHCEICNYQFSFTPIYSEQAPENISTFFFANFVFRRALTLSKFYLRVMLSLFVWLVWVPYLTVWIWRMWFNPMLLLSQTSLGQVLLASSDDSRLWNLTLSGYIGVFQALINGSFVREFSSGSMNSTLLYDDDGSLSDTDWNGLLHTFFADVFEGQIITSIAVIIGLGVLCLKEYILMNTPLDANGNPVNPGDGVAAGPQPPGREEQMHDLREFRQALRNRDFDRALELASRKPEGDAGEVAGSSGGYRFDAATGALLGREGLRFGDGEVDPLNAAISSALASQGALAGSEGEEIKEPEVLKEEIKKALLTLASERGIPIKTQREGSSSASAIKVPLDFFKDLNAKKDDFVQPADLQTSTWLKNSDGLLPGPATSFPFTFGLPGYDDGVLNSSQPHFITQLDDGTGNLMAVAENDGVDTAEEETGPNQDKGKQKADEIDVEMVEQGFSFNSNLSEPPITSPPFSIPKGIFENDLDQLTSSFSTTPPSESLRVDVEKESSLRRADIDAMLAGILARPPSRPVEEGGQAAPSSSSFRGFPPNLHAYISRNRSGLDDSLLKDRIPTVEKGKWAASDPAPVDSIKGTSQIDDTKSAEDQEDVYRSILDARLKETAEESSPTEDDRVETYNKVVERIRSVKEAHEAAQDRLQRHPPVPFPRHVPDIAPNVVAAPRRPFNDPMDAANNQAAPVNNRPVALNVNVAVEVGPNGIAAEVQAQGDINAFLELVGMQGPLENLGQNMITVVLVIVAAIRCRCWLPFITGKIIVWMVTDIYAPVVDTAIAVTTGWLQAFTDPLLDPIVDGVVVLLTWAGIATHLGRGTTSNATFESDLNPTADIGAQNTSSLPMALEEVLSQAANATENLTEFLTDENVTKMENDSQSDVVSALREAHKLRMREAARKLRQPDEAKLWGMPEQLAHTLVGYATHLTLLYYHARRTGRLEHPYAQTMKRICVKWLVYLTTAVKFTFFMTIELGMFPTFCGVLIDLCTLPIFGPTATIVSRWAFYKAFPWSSWFLHWLAGTCFMFQFAIYISTVRKVVRPGVVWFIRDPDDPAFHPMQDIIEKPVLTQLRKLAVGTTAYAFVVISAVGGFVGLVKLLELIFGSSTGPGRIWPIKWEFSEPLSEFPIDLLIFHFVLPWAIAWVRPRQLFRNVVAGWFRFTARRLRLTHFLFGERMRDEESDTEDDEDDVPVRLIRPEDAPAPTVSPQVDADTEKKEATDDEGWVDEDTEGEGSSSTPLPTLFEDGAGPANSPPEAIVASATRAHVRPRPFPYLRVPNHDHVEIIPNQKMMIPMARGEALFGRMNESEDEVRANWRRVYVPDRFRFRTFALIIFQWICGQLLAAAVIIGPLYIGRVVFLQFHDYMTGRGINSTDLSDVMTSTITPTPSSTNISYAPTFAKNVTAVNATSSAASFLVRKFGFLGSPVRPELPIRPDLPVHDLFSFSLGLFIIIASCASALWLERTMTLAGGATQRLMLKISNAFFNAGVEPERPVPTGILLRRRSNGPHRSHSRLRRRRVRSTSEELDGQGIRRRPSQERLEDIDPTEGEDWEEVEYVNIPEEQEVVPLWTRMMGVLMTIGEFAVVGFAVIRVYLAASIKLCFLVFWVGIVIPLLFGLIFQLYIVLPAMSSREQTRIFFFLQDWALGAMYTKIMYTLVLAGPDTELRRALGQARDQLRDGGLNRLVLRTFALKVIFPIVAVCTLIVLPPLGLFSAFETMLGTKSDDPSSTSIQSLLGRYSLIALLAAGAAYEVSQAIGRLMRRWMDQVRDDHYLVGRRLHNLGDAAENRDAGDQTRENAVGVVNEILPAAAG